MGGVPAASYSCDEHVNVNGWTRVGDGPWIPSAEYDEAALAWVNEPRAMYPPAKEADHG